MRTALAEDLGPGGDLTTRLTVPLDAAATASLVSREDGVLSGVEATTAVFATVDPALDLTWTARAGQRLHPGEPLATIRGSAHSILAAERTALNLLGHLTGVASRTAAFVSLAEGTGTRIVDSRSTVPGLRELQKRAVLDGGGTSHRFGLYDAVLVQHTHIELGGGPAAVLERLAAECGKQQVQVEIGTTGQLDTVLAFDAARIAAGAPPLVHAVLLEDLPAWQVATCVARIRRHPVPIVAEVSGGVDETTVPELARSGADAISVGALTHSVRCHDFGLDLSPATTASPPEQTTDDGVGQ